MATLLEKIIAFSEDPMGVAPQNDAPYNREGQAVEVGIPGAPFVTREALMVRPSNLGEEVEYYGQPKHKECEPSSEIEIETPIVPVGEVEVVVPVDAEQYPAIAKILQTVKS